MEQPNESIPLPPPSSSLFSSLPDDIVLDILARKSNSYYPTLSRVSKRFRSLILSEELDIVRSHLGTREQCVNLCLQSSTKPFEYRKWFSLWIKPLGHQFLVVWKINKVTGHWLIAMPSSYSRRLQILHETVGSEIYEIDGRQNTLCSTDVWVYDKLTGKRHKAPSMMVARKNALTCALDGKLYVMAGCDADESTRWAEVFDPKTQTWEALPDPGVELRYSSVKKLQTKQGKLCVRSNNKNFVYHSEERRWEVVESIYGESLCEIKNVCYRYFNNNCWWYDTKKQSWKLVTRLGHFNDIYKSATEIGTCGGKLVVFWDCVVATRITSTKEIWCAVISLDKCEDGEVRGKVEWLDVVLMAPRSYTLSHCMTSLQ